MNEKKLRSFELYLERYCETYHVSKEEAEQHRIPMAVKDYYEKSEVCHGSSAE